MEEAARMNCVVLNGAGGSSVRLRRRTEETVADSADSSRS